MNSSTPLKKASAEKTDTAIIAGSGALPRCIIEHLCTQGTPPFLLALDGHTDRNLAENLHHTWYPIGKVGKIIKALKAEGITRLILAGRVGRPKLADLAMDMTAIRLVSQFRKLPDQGDDRIFSTLISFLESEGFTVIGPDAILQDLIIGEGPIGSITPDKQAKKDITVGAHVARTIGQLDIGQAVIVQNGQILGVEGAEGTDGLISRCANYKQDGPGGILIKMKKPHQDPRVDLPSIGVHTIENAHKSGLRGVAVEAGGALVIDRDAVIEHADRFGLFVTGVLPDHG